MTELPEQAVAEVSKLSQAEQNMFAKSFLDEPASETRWSKLISESQELLEQI